MSKKVFLGGTCNESKWRDKLIPMLKIDYFNPVVEDWNEDAYQEELKQRKECDYCLYVITPRMLGTYSIAEAVDDSNKTPHKTIFCILKEDDRYPDNTDILDKSISTIQFSYGQMKSLNRVGQMIQRNGGKYFTSLEQVAEFLNSRLVVDFAIKLRNKTHNKQFHYFDSYGLKKAEYIVDRCNKFLAEEINEKQFIESIVADVCIQDAYDGLEDICGKIITELTYEEDECERCICKYLNIEYDK